MCGITGYLAKEAYLDRSSFGRATNKLTHRGPDAEGYFYDGDVPLYLGHRRLSILDLSTASNQPFESANGRFLISYNGEVYNFREIKQELGLDVRTTGDTEVILEAFAKIGVKSFSYLNGMYSLAIWDKLEKKLTLCRDRAGIKPLFYYWDGRQFAFASEIKAITALPGLHTQINTAVFPEFLHLGFIPHPHTVFTNIFKFPAAHYTEISFADLQQTDLQIRFKPYWDVFEHVSEEVLHDEMAAKKQLRNLLLDAVEKQLISDVPVGTFLSGGIDSSLITAMAAHLKPDKVKTFSIGYDTHKYDESEYAKNVAKFIGTEHYAVKLNEDDLDSILPEIIFGYDEPFADTSAYPTMVVSKMARQHVTVALSGDGGDELFMGYGMYKWASRLDNPLVKAFRKPFYPFTQMAPYVIKRGGLLLDYSNADHLRSHIFSQEQYYHSEKDLRQLLMDEEFNFDHFNPHPHSLRPLKPKERQSFWDIQHYLKDDLLVKVDRASMKYSLESRVPYLDHRVIEFAINLDESLKYRNGISKYILKEVLYEFLPANLFNRPKWGFALPLPYWLKGKLRYLIDRYTNDTIINRYDILANLYVQDLKNRFLGGEDYLYNRIWTIIVLHWWLEENS
jgi:asparagine synthase (glutamine-hydrolysing)